MSIEPRAAGTPPIHPQPTALSCLNCQLMGHRKLTCAKRDVCKELPHSFALGPVLLLGWLATMIAFFAAVR